MSNAPTPEQLGGLLRVPGSRPVGTYDVAPYARGAQEIAEAGTRFGHALADVGQSAARLGGLARLSEATDANAYIHAGIIGLRQRYRDDPDYATLAQRWDDDAGKIVERGLSGITDEGLRRRVLDDVRAPLAQEYAAVGDQAFRGAAAAHAAARQGYLHNLVVHATLDPDDKVMAGAIDAYHAMVDNAVDRGFATTEGAAAEKRSAALALCAGEYTAMARHDPARALRELGATADGGRGDGGRGDGGEDGRAQGDGGRVALGEVGDPAGGEGGGGGGGGGGGHPLLAVLPEAQKAALVRDARQRDAANRIDAARAPVLAQQQSGRASEEAERGTIADLVGENPSVTANAILDNAALSPDARQRLLGAVARAGEPEPAPQISQATTLALLARIRRPDAGGGPRGKDAGAAEAGRGGGRDGTRKDVARDGVNARGTDSPADVTDVADLRGGPDPGAAGRGSGEDDRGTQKIAAAAPLVEAYGAGKLSKADLGFVAKQLAEAQTPQGALLAARRQDFVDALRQELDARADTDLAGRTREEAPVQAKNVPITDAETVRQLYGAERDLDQRIDRARHDGKDPLDLVDAIAPRGGAGDLRYVPLPSDVVAERNSARIDNALGNLGPPPPKIQNVESTAQPDSAPDPATSASKRTSLVPSPSNRVEHQDDAGANQEEEEAALAREALPDRPLNQKTQSKQLQTVNNTELHTYEPTLFERVKYAMQDTLMAAGAKPYDAGHLAEGLTNLLVTLTPVGIPIAADEAQRAARNGDWLGSIAAAGGIVPGPKLAKLVSTNYRRTFFNAYPELQGQVWVHHAIPQLAFKKYPGVLPEEDLHALDNLRGVPKELNAELHQSIIRNEWNRFFKNNYIVSEDQLRGKAMEIDNKFGHLFSPARR